MIWTFSNTSYGIVRRMEYRKDIVKLMDDCIGCGSCNTVCPSYAKGGSDPMAVLKGNASKVKGCIGCGGCSEVCGYTDPWKVMMYVNCVENGLTVPDVFRTTGYHLPTSNREGVPDAGYSDEGDVCLAPGCLVNSVIPYLENAGVEALNAIGHSVRRLDTGCCTFPVHYRSLTDGERDSIKMRGTDDADGRRIVTLCPGCSNEFSSSGVDASHMVELLYSGIDRIRAMEGVRMRVCIQPGCHLMHLKDEFREVVEATGAEIVEAPIGCCGKAVPSISEMIMDDRQKDMKGSDAVIVGCPSCFIRYDSKKKGIKVLHISELVSLASGKGSTLVFHRN